MSNNLTVQLTEEHLTRIQNATPINGLSELVWNAVDSDATNIRVEYDRNNLSGIERITITDNGHGINHNDIKDTFGKLGNSNKLINMKTPNGRLYHGKTGQGRFKGYVLGSIITWETCYREENEGIYTYQIIGSADELKNFIVTDKVKLNTHETGTKVIVDNVDDEKVHFLGDALSTSEKIGVIMAPYLFAYKEINIAIEGLRVDPSNYLEKFTDFNFSITLRDQSEINGTIKIVEWKNGKHKNMYLCNSQGVTYDDDSVPVKKANFSIYVMSDLIEKMHLKNELSLKRFDPQYIELIKKVTEIARNYQLEKLASEASKTVQKLKKKDVYPYRGEPENRIEEVERQVFDICAVKVHEYLPDFTNNSKPSQKLTLQLLKQAITQNPSSLRKILRDVLDLTTEQQGELAELLEKTTLSAIINTTKIITDRLVFINGLEQILYDKYYEKHLKERSQLHKILLGELWVFGNQYEYGCDDMSLKNVLKEHIEKLDRKELIEAIDLSGIHGLDDIPDLCLWRQYNFGKPDNYENLVIELKRPSCTISEKEISQIKKYAYAIEDEKYFDKEKTGWTFILVGTRLSKYARTECEQDDREFGHIVNKNNLNVYVKEWNQVIQEAKGKLNFIKSKLEFAVEDNSEGLNYLKEKYMELIPQ